MAAVFTGLLGAATVGAADDGAAVADGADGDEGAEGDLLSLSYASSTFFCI